MYNTQLSSCHKKEQIRPSECSDGLIWCRFEQNLYRKRYDAEIFRAHGKAGCFGCRHRFGFGRLRRQRRRSGGCGAKTGRRATKAGSLARGRSGYRTAAGCGLERRTARPSGGRAFRRRAPAGRRYRQTPPVTRGQLCARRPAAVSAGRRDLCRLVGKRARPTGFGRSNAGQGQCRPGTLPPAGRSRCHQQAGI